MFLLEFGGNRENYDIQKEIYYGLGRGLSNTIHFSCIMIHVIQAGNSTSKGSVRDRL